MAPIVAVAASVGTRASRDTFIGAGKEKPEQMSDDKEETLSKGTPAIPAKSDI